MLAAGAGAGEEAREGEETAAPPARAKDKSTELANRRVAGKAAVSRVLSKLHQVLVEQRAHTEELHPSLRAEGVSTTVVPESQTIAEQALREATESMQQRLRELIAAIDVVREATRAVDPKALAKPAVVALAVSAPSTSWAFDKWIQAPMPQLADAVVAVFKASYSNPEAEGNDNSSNRLKRCWANDKIKSNKLKKMRQ